jgi:hypothetical protein
MKIVGRAVTHMIVKLSATTIFACGSGMVDQRMAMSSATKAIMEKQEIEKQLLEGKDTEGLSPSSHDGQS